MTLLAGKKLLSFETVQNTLVWITVRNPESYFILRLILGNSIVNSICRFLVKFYGRQLFCYV